MPSLLEWSNAFAASRSTLELRAMRAAALRDGVPTKADEGCVIIISTPEREDELKALLWPVDNPVDNSGNADSQ